MQQMNARLPAGMIERIKAILVAPKDEWPVIEREPATIGGLYRNYVAILAAVPAVCGLLGGLMGGHSAFGLTYRPSIGAALAGAVTSYGLTLIGVFVLALVIDWLAPRFGGTRSRVQAFKLAAYSGTAAWVAGVFALIPGLAWLTMLGIYGLYLLYLGLPFLMRAPAQNAMGYTAATMLAAVLLSILVGLATAPIVALVAGPGAPGDGGTVSGTMTVPGVGTIDIDKLEEASRRIDRATRRADDGGARPAVPPEALQALLPAAIDGLARTELSSAAGGAGPIGGSHAEGVYDAGDRRITLGISDLGAAGAFAALGSALNVRSNKQTADGYERIDQIDGRMVTEEWHAAGKRGEYNVLVGERFMVEAEGAGVEMATLKQAVAAIGYARLEALAK